MDVSGADLAGALRAGVRESKASANPPVTSRCGGGLVASIADQSKLTSCLEISTGPITNSLPRADPTVKKSQQSVELFRFSRMNLSVCRCQQTTVHGNSVIKMNAPNILTLSNS